MQLDGEGFFLRRRGGLSPLTGNIRRSREERGKETLLFFSINCEESHSELCSRKILEDSKSPFNIIISTVIKLLGDIMMTSVIITFLLIIVIVFIVLIIALGGGGEKGERAS